MPQKKKKTLEGDKESQNEEMGCNFLKGLPKQSTIQRRDSKAVRGFAMCYTSKRKDGHRDMQGERKREYQGIKKYFLVSEK